MEAVHGMLLSLDIKSGLIRIDSSAIRNAAEFDGKLVLETDDDTISLEDAVLGYNSRGHIFSFHAINSTKSKPDHYVNIAGQGYVSKNWEWTSMVSHVSPSFPSVSSGHKQPLQVHLRYRYLSLQHDQFFRSLHLSPGF